MNTDTDEYVNLYWAARTLAKELALPRPTRVVVTGWRGWPRALLLAVDAPLRGLSVECGPLHVTEGGADGLDTLAGEMADEFGQVGWTRHTEPARWFVGWRGSPINPGTQRNQKMVDMLFDDNRYHDICIGWPNPSGVSRGTTDCMTRAHQAGIPTYMVRPRDGGGWLLLPFPPRSTS